jgi:ubiquinone/menaquinone biosynthesis C-methylase UbiE
VFVDFTDAPTIWTEEQIKLCGEAQRVDVVADAGALPFADGSQGFVLTSHMLEHAFDPISMLLEWDRVVRVGGMIFCIVPKRDALPEDAAKPMTEISELVARHEGKIPTPEHDDHRHWTIGDAWRWREFLDWIVENTSVNWELCEFNETDTKVGNGIEFVIRKVSQ